MVSHTSPSLPPPPFPPSLSPPSYPCPPHLQVPCPPKIVHALTDFLPPQSLLEVQKKEVNRLATAINIAPPPTISNDMYTNYCCTCTRMCEQLFLCLSSGNRLIPPAGTCEVRCTCTCTFVHLIDLISVGSSHAELKWKSQEIPSVPPVSSPVPVPFLAQSLAQSQPSSSPSLSSLWSRARRNLLGTSWLSWTIECECARDNPCMILVRHVFTGQLWSTALIGSTPSVFQGELLSRGDDNHWQGSRV